MTTPDEHPAQWQDDEELPIEELARRQGVKPITSVDELAQPSAEPPTGPATASNSMCSGSAPNRVLARDRLEMFGGRHRRPCPASTQPAGSSTPSSSCRPRRR